MSFSKIKALYQEAFEKEKQNQIKPALDLVELGLAECAKFSSPEQKEKIESNKRRLDQLKAHLLEKNNQISEAAKVYDELIANKSGLSPEKLGSFLLKAVSCYSKAKEFHKAEEYCANANQLGALTNSQMLQLALKHHDILKKTNKSQKAMEVLKGFVKSSFVGHLDSSNKALVFTKLLKTQLETGESKEVVLETMSQLNEREVADSQMRLPFLYEKVKVLEKFKMKKELKATVDQAESEGLFGQENSKYTGLIAYMGACNEYKLKNYEQAFSAFDKARKLFRTSGNEEETKNFASVSSSELKCAIKLKKFDVAGEILKEMEQNPKMVDFLPALDIQKAKTKIAETSLDLSPIKEASSPAKESSFIFEEKKETESPTGSEVRENNEKQQNPEYFSESTIQVQENMNDSTTQVPPIDDQPNSEPVSHEEKAEMTPKLEESVLLPPHMQSVEKPKETPKAESPEPAQEPKKQEKPEQINTNVRVTETTQSQVAPKPSNPIQDPTRIEQSKDPNPLISLLNPNLGGFLSADKTPSSQAPRLVKKPAKPEAPQKENKKDVPQENINQVVELLRKGEFIGNFLQAKTALETINRHLEDQSTDVFKWIDEAELAYMKYYVDFNNEKHIDVNKVEEFYLAEKKTKGESSLIATKLLILIGKLKIKSNDLLGAEKYFKKALLNANSNENLFQEKVECHYYCAKILMMDKKFEELDSVFEFALRDCLLPNPSARTILFQAKIYFLKGCHLKRQNRMKESFEAFEEADKLLKNNEEFTEHDKIEFNFEFCGVLVKNNMYEAAEEKIAYLVKTIDCFDQIPETGKKTMKANLFYYNADHFFNMGKLERAKEFAEKSLEMLKGFESNSDFETLYPDTLYVMGSIQESLENWPKCIELFQKAYDEFVKREADTQGLWALMKLANAFDKVGNKKEAKSAFSACKENAKWVTGDQTELLNALKELGEKMKK